MNARSIRTLPIQLTSGLVAVLFLAGFDAQGCIEPYDGPPPTRPVPLSECYADEDCAAGERCVLTDEAPDPEQDPMPGYDDVYEPCMAPPPGSCEPIPTEACTTDADCAPGGYCEHYSACLSLDCEPAPPSQCVYPHTNCDDGSDVLCDMIPPACSDGLILAARNGCWDCVDPATCESPQDPCFGAWIDAAGTCRAPNDGVYPAECCPTFPPPECTTDADCPNGYCEQFASCAGLDCPPAPAARCVFFDDCESLGEADCLGAQGCRALYTPRAPSADPTCGPDMGFVRCEVEAPTGSTDPAGP